MDADVVVPSTSPIKAHHFKSPNGDIGLVNSVRDIEIGATHEAGVTFTNAKGGFAPRDHPTSSEETDSVHFLQEDKVLGSFKSSCGSAIKANRSKIYPAIIFLVGCIASAAFLTLGITGAKGDLDALFESRARELAKDIESVWVDYELGGSWIHEACHNRNVTRLSFSELYQYMVAAGLDFQAISFNPNVTHSEREGFESEAGAFYQEFYPDFSYRGFVGLEPDSAKPDGPFRILPRSIQPFYFPVHYMEPMVGNEASIDFDLYSSSSRRQTINLALATWQPALTPRLQLVQETDPSAYSVILFHPGAKVHTATQARDLSSTVIRIPSLFARILNESTQSISYYLFDATDTANPPQFLGGVVGTAFVGHSELTLANETSLSDVRASSRRFLEREITVSSRTWIVAVTALHGTYEANVTFVVLGGIMIFITCVCLAVWVDKNMLRASKISALKSQAQQEKAALIVRQATESARAERELNDFIAHEVRNPLAAAMSACTFVSSAVNDETAPFMDTKSLNLVKEDVVIIDSSLHFINDLLRNMLDMQRAASNQLKIEMCPTDLLKDVLQPVDSMLYRRGDNWNLELDCPKNLVVMTDGLRLKQIVLNLSRNSAKFVDNGFIRVRAIVVDGMVQILVEDSGPGVPLDKRANLFARFQETLDSLSQGTGIGLCLCKNLAELMKGDIWLDETYDSGIKDCPGTRFVINLNTQPLQFDDDALDAYAASNVVNINTRPEEAEREGAIVSRELPEKMSMLFVDDDLVLRKLFTRAVKKVAPGWDIQEAANGETAVRLVDSHEYDLIFIDQYMASAEKQLLGTETARALRAKGVKSIICGLSANDVKQSFQDAGANAFMFKPFPCQCDELKRKLLRILFPDDEPPSS
jgi:signal transduction histidine kinase/CheY-like chemotaxis protein